MMQPHLGNVVGFLERIAADSHPSDTLLANAAGLIGCGLVCCCQSTLLCAQLRLGGADFSDLMSAFGKAILPLLESEAIGVLLTKGRRAKTQKTKTLAAWATREMKKLKSAGT